MDSFTIGPPNPGQHPGSARRRDAPSLKECTVATSTGDSTLQTEVLEDLSDARRVPALAGRPRPARTWASTRSRSDRVRATTPSSGCRQCRPVHLHRGRPTTGCRRCPPASPTTTPSGCGTCCWARGRPRMRPATTAPPSRSTSSSTSRTTSPRCGRWARWCDPGGAVVLIVPAFPSAMSRFDLAIGHQRRYTRRSLGAALRERRPRRRAAALRQPDRPAQLVRDGQGTAA